MKDRPISYLIEETEDEQIMKLREALLKKEETTKTRKETETVIDLNLSNRQIINKNKFKISNFTKTFSNQKVKEADTKQNNMNREFIYTNVRIKQLDPEKPLSNSNNIKEISVNVKQLANKQKENNSNDEADHLMKNLRPNIMAGSHFDNLKPENGVTFAEGSRIKSGDNIYANQFGRMSNKEYEKMKLIYNNTRREHENQWLSEKITSPIQSKGDIRVLSSKAKEKDNEKHLSKMMQSSKKIILEEIEEVNSNRNLNQIHDQIVFNENIFKTRRLSDLKFGRGQESGYHQEINNFTYNIENFKGNINNINSNIESLQLPSIVKRPSKPNIRQIEKELGQSIVNKKLPRSRIKQKLI